MALSKVLGPKSNIFSRNIIGVKAPMKKSLAVRLSISRGHPDRPAPQDGKCHTSVDVDLHQDVLIWLVEWKCIPDKIP